MSTNSLVKCAYVALTVIRATYDVCAIRADICFADNATHKEQAAGASAPCVVQI